MNERIFAAHGMPRTRHGAPPRPQPIHAHDPGCPRHEIQDGAKVGPHDSCRGHVVKQTRGPAPNGGAIDPTRVRRGVSGSLYAAMMDRNRIILDLFSKHETWADGVPGARRLDEAMVHLRLQSQGASNPDGL